MASIDPGETRIDDVLLRTGFLVTLLVVLAIFAWRPWESRNPMPQTGNYVVTFVNGKGRLTEKRVHVNKSIATEEERIRNLEGRYPNALDIRRSPPPRFHVNVSRQEMYFYGTALAPLALMGTGFFLRRRERRLIALRNLLRANVETDVRELLANSDFTRSHLQDAVRSLNNSGTALFVWHHDTDTIQDSRLDGGFIQINRCGSCGASVGLKVKASLRKAPACPYCETPFAAAEVNALKREAIRELRNEHAHSPASLARATPEQNDRRPISMWLFVLLLIVFWPAALGYAVYKMNRAPL